MTRRAIGSDTELNPSRDFTGRVSPCVGDDRTIVITISRFADQYEVYAFGTSFALRGSHAYGGRSKAGLASLRVSVATLNRAWRHFVDFQEPLGPSVMGAPKHLRPVTEELDLRKAIQQDNLDRLWRRLAEAGYQLFRNLFDGDAGLRRLARQLSEVLWNDEQTITVISDDFVAPWSMLYVPRDPDASLRDSAVDANGFIGYRHRIEHSFKSAYEESGEPHSDIFVADGLAAGVYYDTRLDKPFRSRPAASVVAPVLELISQHATVVEGTVKDTLQQHFEARRVDRHLLYFCCHCINPTLDDEALLQLSDEDGESTSAAELRAWRAMLQHRPLVILNACRAAQSSSHSLGEFSTVLLSKGAGCVIGPTINIPTRFAAQYGQDLLSRILPVGGRRFGATMRDLTQAYVKEYQNPLGLAYSLYAGIDGHFCRWEDDRAVTVA